MYHTDPRAESLKRYQLALRSGYVSVNLIKVLVIGAAGVGKTHLLHLVIGEPLPSVRQSTPIMARPVQTFLSMKKDTDTFQKVTSKELNELLANTVNRSVPEQIPSEHPACITLASNPKVTELHQNCGNSYQHTESLMNDTDSIHSSEVNMTTFKPSELEQELIPMIAQFEEAPLMTVDWIYFTDTGGQPEFHQLLLAFVPNTDRSVFVLKLCDNLDAYPPAAFYDNGNCINQTHHSALTNKEILMHYTQAMHSGPSESRLMVVGTFRDKELECTSETREKKEEELKAILMEQYTVYSSTSGKIIFPLNTLNPEALDMEVIREIRKNILSANSSIKNLSLEKKTNVPLKWLVFHQELLRASKDILSFEQCMQIASRLNMVEVDVMDSLKFFADLNVIMYYPTILKGLVFINPQLILNIVTQLVKSVAYDDSIKATDNLVLKAQKSGTISEELLHLLNKDVRDAFNELFQPKHLFMILIHLKIVSEYQTKQNSTNDVKKSEYFMPSLLKQMSPKCIAEVIKKYRASFEPAIIKHKNAGCLKLGEFCSFITSLLISNQFIIAYSNNKPLCLHSNIMVLSFGTSLVTFVDCVAHMEIHVSTADAALNKKVCSSIMHFFHSEIQTEHKLTFLCPCKPCDSESRHPAALFIEEKMLQCTISPTVRNPLNSEHELWVENMKGKLLAIFNYGKKAMYNSCCK